MFFIFDMSDHRAPIYSSILYEGVAIGFFCCCKSCCPCSFGKETLFIRIWGTSPGMWRRLAYVRQPFVLESESVLMCAGPVHLLPFPACFH